MCSRFPINLAVLIALLLAGCNRSAQPALPAEQPSRPIVIGSALDPGVGYSLVTTDPRAAAYADRVIFLADGAVAGEIISPTADSVIEEMKRLGD